MASTVEPCESNPPGLSVLSSTMEMFDTFKSSLKEDEKDSDEESFHLPMLGCDDDTDSNNKDIMSGTDTTVAENEDDILNKFETIATPDLDPKVEESILKDIEDDILSTNREDGCANEKTETDKLSNSTTENIEVIEQEGDGRDSSRESKEDLFEDLEVVDDLDDNKKEVSVAGKQKENKDSETKDCLDEDEEKNVPEQNEETKNEKHEDAMVIEDVEDRTELDENISAEEQNEDSNVNEESTLEKDTSEQEKMNAAEDVNDGKDKHDKSKVDEIMEEVDSTEDPKQTEDSKVEEVDEQSMDIDGEKSKDANSEVNPSEAKKVDSSSDAMNDEKDETEEVKMNCDEDDGILNDLVKEVNDKLDSDGDEMMPDVTIPDKQEIAKDEESADSSGTVEKVAEHPPSASPPNSELEKISEVDKQADLDKSQQTSLSGHENENKPTDAEEESISNDINTDLKKTSEEKKQLETREKKDVSQSDTTASNLECDDLLDVSVIRNLDEDDADAIEDNTAQSSEKSDNDDQEDDKADNEIDESEVDQEENVISSDNNERMESEDGNSNVCGPDISTTDDVISEVIVDSESKDVDDVVMKENEAPVVPEKLSTGGEEDQSVQPNEPEENKEAQVGLSLGKRPLSDESDVEIASKKIRLSDVSEEKTEAEMTKKVQPKGSNLKTLISFEKFMQNKKFSNTKLTRSDLEQFCLQKICEAIIHKTDVGELHHTIKKQEQIIDNLRKDLLQLSKQARDLDIVNKKLMNELKTQNGTRKPLVPLKITRSVGLQVKLNIGVEQPTRRKQTVNNTPKTPTTPANNASVLRTRTVTSANANVVRQVHQTTAAATATATPTTPAPSPRKAITTTPILSQALQPRVTPIAPKRTPARAKAPAEPAKPAQPGVIDLTDEDDKAGKNASQQQVQQVKTPQQAKTAQQVKTVQQVKAGQQVKTIQATPMKILNKTMPVVQQRTVNIMQNKAGTNKLVAQANVVQQQQAKGGARPLAQLPQGVRLTPAQLKNGLTLPGVVTSSASGTPQLMYVVPSLTSAPGGGTQKAVLLNFQPTSQVLTSTINGSTVSMSMSKGGNTMQLKTIVPRKHPAPLPLTPPSSANSSLKPLLPKPHLSIRKTDTGIILQWRMPYNLDVYESIASYQLFAYQETNAPPSSDMWRKVGDVKALALPMACTLTQFADKNKYYFAVRSVDVHKRIGAFSDPEEISL